MSVEIERLGFMWHVIEGYRTYGEFALYRNAWKLKDEFDRGVIFFCPGCEEIVDSACGAADDMPELCDNCWGHVTKRREEAQAALEAIDV